MSEGSYTSILDVCNKGEVQNNKCHIIRTVSTLSNLMVSSLKKIGQKILKRGSGNEMVTEEMRDGHSTQNFEQRVYDNTPHFLSDRV